jgi:apolipoprotein D and lipocalin family protein
MEQWQRFRGNLGSIQLKKEENQRGAVEDMNKKIVAAGLLVLFAALLVRAEKKSKEPLRVVPSVDLARYTGRWYEIARLPNRFEEKCASDVTAEYALLETGRLKVVNQCRKKDGSMTRAEGSARLADKGGANSRLKVRFAPGFLSFLPFVWGDYQIMELAPDYSYALVGEPSRKYLWILSRTPQMDEGTYRQLTEAAAAQGFDVSRLIRIKQG